MSFLYSGGLYDVIPDSAIHHYDPDNFTASNWPDEIGTSDIDTITGLAVDSIAFDGAGGVQGDGTSDNGLSDTMGSFGSNMDTDFAISIPIETTDNDAVILGTINDGDTVMAVNLGDPFGQGYTSNAIGIDLRDAGNNTLREAADVAVNGGNSHHVIINKTGNSGGSIDFYYDDMSTPVASSTVSATGFSTPANFDYPMAYYARNLRGTIDTNIAATLGNVRWFNDSLSEDERTAVDINLPWT